ncbi:MAG: hypothetical protein R3A13_02155 [Bdellovibrionota bacterium]
MKTQKCAILFSILALTMMGCSSKPQPQPIIQQVAVETDYTRQVPGIVEHVWEEPMTDVVDVPPGLDPEGHYYRPAHQSIVEIRQGRWRYLKAK